MRKKREVQRSDHDWNLQFGSHDALPDHTPSPDEHPEFGALPSRPPPDTPTSSLPPPPCPAPRTTGHTSYLPHQQLAGQPLHFPSNGSLSSVNTSSPTHFIGQPRPPVGHMDSPTHLNGQLQPHPPGSHMTESSSDSSVFAYGSSSDYSSSSCQATPTGSGRSLKSTSSDCSSSMSILHFSYSELSEATGGFTEGLVGIGAFGTVFRAKIRGNGPYAIKKLHTVS